MDVIMDGCLHLCIYIYTSISMYVLIDEWMG